MIDLASWNNGWLWIAAAFVSTYIKGICGFGNSMVFTAVMNFAADNINISPVEVVMGMPANVIMAWKERKSLDYKLCIPLTILLLIGMLPGIFILKAAHPEIVKKICGAVIVLLGLWMLFTEGRTLKRNRLITIIAGLIAGILSGMYGIAIVLGSYISITTEDVHSIKANLSFIFAAENTIRIIAYICAGIITLQTLTRSVILLPFMVLGLGAGMFTARFIDNRKAKFIVIAMLIASGIALIVMTGANRDLNETAAVSSETVVSLSEGGTDTQEAPAQTDPVQEISEDRVPSDTVESINSTESVNSDEKFKIAESSNSTDNRSEDALAVDEYENTEDYYNIELTFAGDINFDENWYTTQYMNTCENGIRDCISAELIDTMNRADIMWINNEFTYSDRGQPMEGKAYTFRADPSRVDNLKTLGVDIVGLANNHVYDYGEEAFLDTLDTLDRAGIPYIGAGRNLEEAMEPYYFEIGGVTIAYVAASRAEKIKLTPQATETSPGILRCYDTELFDEEIAEAKENADFVIACPHWGTEYSTQLEEVQLETAKEYIDAGADAIIGAHTHCLQGMEFYEGKPVVFSLGNYWFNEKTLDTMLVTLNLYNDENGKGVRVSITPAIQENLTTKYVSDPEKQRELYDYLESISVNIAIDNDGNVTERD